MEVNYLQPEYFETFKCDGQKCNAACCKFWRISIDEDSLQKYRQAESADKEISSHIKFSDKSQDYAVVLCQNGFCPFLSAENLCKIQLKYGEDFLSRTCKTYPRTINMAEGIPVPERSLTLSCPVAADLILFSALPIKFKLVKESVADTSNFLANTYTPPRSILPHAQKIRLTAIKILQERDLTIDQRLAVVGVFLDIIDETIKAEKFDDLPQIFEMYESKDIIYKSVQAVWNEANFDYKEFVKLMLSGVMETLYGKEPKNLGKVLFGAFKAFLNIDLENLDENALDKAVEKFKELEPLHETFNVHFEIVFENWLVNEFFINCYPWHVEKSIPNNFGVFVATYKIIELMAFVESLVNNALKKQSLLDTMIYFARHIDHNTDYIKKISDEIGEENNIPKLVSAFLKTRNF
ncbi:MAG: flagellin lysine-N-methylase [Selenomonadaceae bacterium]|nr:flagellin lysine-N-methylase [Selenomonadaceae bacterium]